MLGRPALYEPVRKNLDAMLYFLYANREVATGISRRQDRFQRATLSPYYVPYRFLARRDQNRRFAAGAATFPHSLKGLLVVKIMGRLRKCRLFTTWNSTLAASCA
jgi:hypothetical protein